MPPPPTLVHFQVTLEDLRTLGTLPYLTYGAELRHLSPDPGQGQYRNLPTTTCRCFLPPSSAPLRPPPPYLSAAPIPDRRPSTVCSGRLNTPRGALAPLHPTPCYRHALSPFAFPRCPRSSRCLNTFVSAARSLLQNITMPVQQHVLNWLYSVLTSVHDALSPLVPRHVFANPFHHRSTMT